MTSAHDLRRLFGILTATSLTGVMGCTSSIDRKDFTQNACQGSAYDQSGALTGVTPAAAVDYVALLSISPYGGGDDGMESDVNEVSVQGTPCLTPSSAACNQQLATAIDGVVRQGRTAGWSSPYSEFTTRQFIVFTRGDEVGTVTSLEALKTFLAPFENVRDATLLLQVALPGHTLLCDENNTHVLPDGFEFLTNTGTDCGEGTHLDENRVFVSSTGEVSIRENVVVSEGDSNCVIGRRPEGLLPCSSRARTSKGVDSSARIGSYFADAARLEAASVHAFERLGRELRLHRAPRSLVRDASRAKADEVRHARTTRRLAKRFGATAASPRVTRMPERPLFAVAEENAVEGCVRETFGALVATYQAKHAQDPEIRQAMQVIADDETRHAALAWDVATWAETLLSIDERKLLAARRREALAELAHAVEGDDFADPRVGVPPKKEALALLQGVAIALRL